MAHECPAGDCTETVPDERLMCPADWRLVPKPHQGAVYRAYDRGAGLGSDALAAAQDAAIRAVNRVKAGRGR